MKNTQAARRIDGAPLVVFRSPITSEGYIMSLAIFDQHRKIKAEYPDNILLFRVGDFYEAFRDDALTVAKLLGLSITTRIEHAESVAMVCFPHHACEIYLQKIVKAGLRIAVITI